MPLKDMDIYKKWDKCPKFTLFFMKHLTFISNATLVKTWTSFKALHLITLECYSASDQHDKNIVEKITIKIYIPLPGGINPTAPVIHNFWANPKPGS